MPCGLLIRTGLPELARYSFVAIRGVMGGKEANTFCMDLVGFKPGVFHAWPIRNVHDHPDACQIVRQSNYNLSLKKVK